MEEEGPTLRAHLEARPTRTRAPWQRASWEMHPSTAHSALEKLVDSDNPEAASKAEDVRAAADLYRRMGDTDSAKKAVEKAMSLAEKVYRQDTDADDPNKALKAYWPSTQTW